MDGDTLFHKYNISIKLYTAGQVGNSNHTNPDGSLLAPIFYFEYRARWADFDPGLYRHELNLSLLFPITRNFSLGGGANIYQDDDPYEVDDYFGLLHIFPQTKPDTHGRLYPDGVNGVSSFYMTAGGSGDGLFGQIETIVPLEPKVAVGVVFRGEQVKKPKINSIYIGGLIRYYPGL